MLPALQALWQSFGMWCRAFLAPLSLAFRSPAALHVAGPTALSLSVSDPGLMFTSIFSTVARGNVDGNDWLVTTKTWNNGQCSKKGTSSLRCC